MPGPSHRSWRWLWPGGFAVLVVATLAGRPLIPIDETRYVGVAWNMWVRGDWWVPFLDGAPYSDKPPLLFWLILGGWRAMGPCELWARLVPCACALASLLAIRRMARTLWPGEPATADLAPLVAVSCVLWGVFSTTLMFDALLTCWVLATLLGWLALARGRWGSGLLLAGLGIGLGMLTKGPVVLVHVLPVALLAPVWATWAGGADRGGGGTRARWLSYSASVGAALALGAGVALAWAVPAANSGGEAYANAILWDQTAMRLVDAVDHGRPWWWYAPLLPLLLWPWSLWPPLWRAVAAVVRRPDAGTRFVLAWLAPSVAILSFVSAKQAHYLLPAVPAFALLAARGIAPCLGSERKERPWIPAATVALLGLVLWIGAVARPGLLPASWDRLHAGWGVALVATGALLAGWRRTPAGAVGALALAGIASLVLGLGAVMQAGREAFDLRPIARAAARLEAEGAPIGYLGSYNAEFAFLGRLERPIAELHSHIVERWMESHPDGYVLVRTEDPPAGPEARVLLRRPYRSDWIELWRVPALLRHPERWRPRSDGRPSVRSTE